MTGTVEREFKIAEKSDDYIWLEVINGHNQGIQIAIPKTGEYDQELQRKINDLDEGEVIEAKIISVNENNTAWKFDHVPGDSRDQQDHHDRQQLSASD